MTVGLILGLFVAIVILIIGLYIRRRSMSFEGVVIDKDISEQPVNNMNQVESSGITFGGNNNGVRHVYTIKVQTNTGKTLRWQISEGKYQIINIGDRVSKASGTTDINVITKAQTSISPEQPVASTLPPNFTEN